MSSQQRDVLPHLLFFSSSPSRYRRHLGSFSGGWWAPTRRVWSRQDFGGQGSGKIEAWLALDQFLIGGEQQQSKWWEWGSPRKTRKLWTTLQRLFSPNSGKMGKVQASGKSITSTAVSHGSKTQAFPTVARWGTTTRRQSFGKARWQRLFFTSQQQQQHMVASSPAYNSNGFNGQNDWYHSSNPGTLARCWQQTSLGCEGNAAAHGWGKSAWCRPSR